MAYNLQHLQHILKETKNAIEGTKKENDELLNDLDGISKAGRKVLSRTIAVNEVSLEGWGYKIKKIEKFIDEIEKGERTEVDLLELTL